MKPEQLKRVLGDVFNLVEEGKVLWQRIGKALAADLEFGVAQVGKELGIENFQVPPADAIKFLAGRQNAIGEINRNTFNSLMTELQDGLAGGESYQQLADRVKDVYRHASDERAETIAITETNIAVNSGRFAGMKRAGVELKGWGVSTLSNIRPAHQAAGEAYQDGIPIDEPFVVGGERLMHPGDPNGSPGNVINCRCFTFAVLPKKSQISNLRSQIHPTLGFESFLGRKNAPGGAESDFDGRTHPDTQPREES